MGAREDASRRANEAMDRGERAAYEDLMECDMDTVRRAQQMERATYPRLAAVVDEINTGPAVDVHTVAARAEFIDRYTQGDTRSADEYKRIQDEYRRIGWIK